MGFNPLDILAGARQNVFDLFGKINSGGCVGSQFFSGPSISIPPTRVLQIPINDEENRVIVGLKCELTVIFNKAFEDYYDGLPALITNLTDHLEFWGGTIGEDGGDILPYDLTIHERTFYKDGAFGNQLKLMPPIKPISADYQNFLFQKIQRGAPFEINCVLHPDGSPLPDIDLTVIPAASVRWISVAPEVGK